MKLSSAEDDLAGLRHRRSADFISFHNVASFRFVGNLEVIACLGYALQPKNFHRSRWRRIFDGATTIIKHRAHFAEYRSANKEIAGVQGSVLHKDCRHWTASFIDA